MQVKTGTGNKGLDWIFVCGMLAAFPKTADLLSYWSPGWLNDLVGFDVSLWYGAFCAAMVEGTILFLHFDRRAHNLPTAQAIKWIMFGVSFACQIFDGYVSTDTVANMSDNLKVVLTYGIPALPLIITVLVGLIGALPEDGEATEIVRQPQVGFVTRLNNFWYGEENRTSNVSKMKIVEHPKEGPNGEKELDFTNRQGR